MWGGKRLSPTRGKKEKGRGLSPCYSAQERKEGGLVTGPRSRKEVGWGGWKGDITSLAEKEQGRKRVFPIGTPGKGGGFKPQSSIGGPRSEKNKGSLRKKGREKGYETQCSIEDLKRKKGRHVCCTPRE